MSVFADALDTLYESELAVDATYAPRGGGPVPVRVMRVSPDVIEPFGGTRIIKETNVFRVRVSEVAEASAGDIIEIDGEQFEVQSATQRDPQRLEWTLDTKPAA